MTGSRLLDALRAIVRETFPRLDFFGLYRYRVMAMNGNRVDLQVVKKANGLPDLQAITMPNGVAGAWSELDVGQVVLVAFAEGDPSLPVITHFAPRDTTADAWLPVQTRLDASDEIRIGSSVATAVRLVDGDQPIAREGDTTATGTLTIANTAPPGGILITYTPPGLGAVPVVATITGPSVSPSPTVLDLDGLITSGADKAFA